MTVFPKNRLTTWVGKIGLAAVLTLGLGLVSACDTAEERADKHYQAGLALLEEGDPDRALIEIRNALKLNGKHEGALLTFARIQYDRGAQNAAYGGYLRVVEQYPENLEGRRALAEMASSLRNWEEAERHVTKAIELSPDDVRMQSIENAVNYFHALQDKDETAQEASVIKAQALIEEDNTLRSSRDLLLDDLIRKREWYDALDLIEESISVEPDNLELYKARLGILEQIGDLQGVETQLRELMERIPEERGDFKQALVRFFVSQNRLDEAENFLREEANADQATPEEKWLLVGFLEKFKGRDAALEEVETQIALDTPEKAVLRSMRAKLRFELGATDEAIAEMEELIEGAERNGQTREFEVDLARMLFRQDNSVGARALVEKVLAEDPSQPSAVKLKANWLIDDDETGDAIVMLRDALNQAPQDAGLMSLLAKAYEREGNRELQSEMLALAVQASNNGAAESIRYSAILVEEDKLVAAEGVLIDALRLAPGDARILAMLGSVYSRLEDWGRADAVVKALKRIDDPEAKVRATALEAEILAKQERGEDLTNMLEGLRDDPAMSQNAEIALVRTRLAAEGPEAAYDYLSKLLEANPDDPVLRFLKAGFLAGFNEPEEAKAIFRSLVEEDARRANVWLALYRLEGRTGDTASRNKVLDDAIVALPENANLLWAKAGELERAGEIEKTIEIYESMYKRNSNSLVAANNLASLLATHRSDEESLQRAYTVARRLRDSEVPAFQDTFGWIAFRRGDQETSLEYLQAAAVGIPGDVTVQYHLAANLAALARNQEALEQFRKVAEMIDPENPPEFAAEVASEIKRLESEPAKE